MKTSCKRYKAVMLEWIRRTIRYSANISVEVVDTTNADICHVMETYSAKNCLAVSREEELLLADLHVNGIGCGSCWGIERLNVISGDYSYGSWLRKHSNDEDRVCHILPAVRPALKVISAGVVRWDHRGICSVAVKASRIWPIPVNELI